MKKSGHIDHNNGPLDATQYEMSSQKNIDRLDVAIKNLKIGTTRFEKQLLDV
jgi:hypothetical protein